MKFFTLLIFASFSLLEAQTEFNISNLELSRHQPLGFEKINEKIYITSYGGSGPAILDVYNTANGNLEKNILNESGNNITFVG